MTFSFWSRGFIFIVLFLISGTCWWCRDTCTATLSTDNILTIKGNGKIEGYPDSYPPWCSDKVTPKQVVIENGLTAIGVKAFVDCVTVTSVKIPSSVKLIEEDAFAYCSELKSGSLGTITWSLIEENKKLIFEGKGNMPDFYENGAPWSTFYSDVETVEFKGEITSIGDFAFSGFWMLETISIPSTIESIGFNANIPESDIPQNVKRPMACGVDCHATFSSGVLTIEGDGKTTNSVSSWGSVADETTKVVIGKGIASISCELFAGWRSLVAFDVDESNSKLASEGGVIFTKDMETLVCYPAGKKDEGYTIPNGITAISAHGFQTCQLKTITITTGVTTIGESAFYESSLESIIIENGITEIKDRTFSFCSSLKNVNILSSVKLIGYCAFNACSNVISGKLGSIAWAVNEDEAKLLIKGTGDMPNFLAKGAPWSASCSSVTAVEVEKGITSIGDFAFYECEKLEQVSLPQTVKSIGVNSNVKGAVIRPDVNQIMSCGINCSAKLVDDTLIIEGSGEMIDFFSPEYIPWKQFQKSIKEVEISEGILTIGEYAFSECTSLVSVHIPTSLKMISNFAFHGCSSLASITVPDEVTTIGNSAFYGCSSLTSVHLSKVITIIGSQAFSKCERLSSLLFEGTNEPRCDYDLFSETSLSIVHVPDDYRSSTFCGVAVDNPIPHENETKSSKLSSGVIIAIVICCLILVIAIGIVCFIVFRSKFLSNHSYKKEVTEMEQVETDFHE